MPRVLLVVLTIATVVLIGLVVQPIGIAQQTLIGVSLIALMLFIRTFKLGGFWRLVFFVSAVFLALRYISWRATSTLPPIEPFPDFVAGILVFAAEIFAITLLAINLFVVAAPRDRPSARRLSSEEAPTIDVFVPSYNEPATMLAATLSAAKAMDYPRDKVTFWLLDDGGTDEKVDHSDPAISGPATARRKELQMLCAELGVLYLTRPRNVGAKAGNLSNGLAHSTGEFVVVFDADHAPARDFLQETVGYLVDDDDVFLVQTPHFFLNPDPVERNLGTFEKMPSENEMFYGLIQRGLDRYNASFFCGSAAVLRRTALEEAGGFSGTSITEDAETALDLHARGWKSVYVEKNMIAGLQPETFASFIGQRTRWCTGMIQIFLTKNPWLRKGLSVPQRLGYTASSAFWFFPVPRLIFVFAPLLYLFFSLEIYVATVEEFFAYTIVYLIAAVLTQSYVYGLYRWPWISEVYEYVKSVYLFPAIVATFLNPRKPTFKVTAKDETLDNDHLSELAWPFIAIFALLVSGLVMTVYRYETDPEITGLLAIVGAWNLFNLVIAGVGLGVVAERREIRRNQRLDVARRGSIAIEGESVPVMIEDVSIGGMKVRLLEPIKTSGLATKQAVVTVTDAKSGQLDQFPVTIQRVLSEDAQRALGLKFETLTASHFALLSEAMFGDLSALSAQREKRRQFRSILWSAVVMTGWAIYHAGRALGYLVMHRGGRKTQGGRA